MEDMEMDFQVLPELTPEEQKQIEAEHEARLRKFYNSTQEYSLENWYQPLADFTFSSFSFYLTNIEAYLLTAIYNEDQSVLMRKEIQSARDSLMKKVDQFLQKHFPSGCFMKLSTRSPKDVGWRYQDESKMNYHVDKLVSVLSGCSQLDRKTMSMIYRYFLEESKNKLKVCTPNDFLDIFTHSQRIQIDLNDLAYLNDRAFRKLAEEDYSSAHDRLIDVWGRQWVDCQWMEEFRCFFHNYQLTAICQYDQRCCFEQLTGKQKLIGQKTCDFFNRICPKLREINMSKGVMDLIVKMSEQPVILIQINVFNHNSRASLFNWEADLHLLQKGPLEIRILEQYIEISKYQLVKMMGMVEKGIEGVLEKVMKELNLEEQWLHLS